MRPRHFIVSAFAALLFFGQLAQAQTAPQKIFHGVGEVTGVDVESGLVLLNHQAISGLMDAMEMQFEAKPATLVQGLKKGDRVEFDINGANLVIVEIHKRK